MADEKSPEIQQIFAEAEWIIKYKDPQDGLMIR